MEGVTYAWSNVAVVEAGQAAPEEDLRYCFTFATVVVRSAAMILDAFRVDRRAMRDSFHQFLLGAQKTSLASTDSVVALLRVPLVSIDANWNGVIVHSVNFPPADELWDSFLRFVHALCVFVCRDAQVPASAAVEALHMLDTWMLRMTQSLGSISIVRSLSDRASLDKLLFGQAFPDSPSDTIGNITGWPPSAESLGTVFLTAYFAKQKVPHPSGADVDSAILSVAQQVLSSLPPTSKDSDADTAQRLSMLSGNPAMMAMLTSRLVGAPGSNLQGLSLPALVPLLSSQNMQASSVRVRWGDCSD